MPKRKKLPKTPDYVGMGAHSDIAEIQKARPLQSLSETDLTLPEFKILDAYLARINSRDPDKRTVQLEKEELEKALGVSEIKQDDLEKRLRHLFQVIKVKDDRKRKGFKLINLFEEADAEQDENGSWQITLTCTASAREYVFNVENLGYLRYRLKNVINLTSRYSYVLFLYLLDNRFRKTWSIDLVELKALLNCNADTYKQYYRFNDLILKKCHNELCEKTDIRFDYRPIKRGRSVSAVEFTVTTLNDELTEQHFAPLDSIDKNGEFVGQTSLFDNMTDTNTPDYAAICDNEIDIETIRLCVEKIKNKGVSDENIPSVLREQWLTFCAERKRKSDNGKRIGNKSKYLIRMIDNYKPPIKDEGESSFSIDEWYKQTEYDPEKISFKNDEGE